MFLDSKSAPVFPIWFAYWNASILLSQLFHFLLEFLIYNFFFQFGEIDLMDILEALSLELP